MKILNHFFHPFALLHSIFRGNGWKLMVMLLFFLLWGGEINAQVKVITEQNVAFGSFVAGNGGGTVTVSHDGARTATGDIQFMNSTEQFHPVIFEVEAPSGRRVYIQNGPDFQMTGSNGEKVTVSLGESSHGSSFISNPQSLLGGLLNNLLGTPYKTLVSVGATLSAGNSTATPPGEYAGTFSVTFILD